MSYGLEKGQDLLDEAHPAAFAAVIAGLAAASVRDARFTAYHEAGHAVVAIIHGLHIAWIRVECDDSLGHTGMVRYARAVQQGRHTPPKALRKRAHIALAGRIAEALAGRHAASRGKSGEDNDAEKANLYLALAARLDPTKVDVHKEIAEVRRLLRENWKAVRALAALLHSRGRRTDYVLVEGAMVERTVRLALHDATPSAGPRARTRPRR